jgi:hypothetical protein
MQSGLSVSRTFRKTSGQRAKVTASSNSGIATALAAEIQRDTTEAVCIPLRYRGHLVTVVNLKGGLDCGE